MLTLKNKKQQKKGLATNSKPPIQTTSFMSVDFEPQEPSIFGDRYAPSVYNRASVAGGFWTGIGGGLFVGITKWDPFFGGNRESGIKNKLQMYGTFEGIFPLIGAFLGLGFCVFLWPLYWQSEDFWWLQFMNLKVHEIKYIYPPKTNMEPKNRHLEDVFSFSNGWFSGSMLNFGGVCTFLSKMHRRQGDQAQQNWRNNLPSSFGAKLQQKIKSRSSKSSMVLPKTFGGSIRFFFSDTGLVFCIIFFEYMMICI